MPRYIIKYKDKYANTGYGRIVITGEKILNAKPYCMDVNVISPTSFKNKWSQMQLSDLIEIPEDIPEGFYSSKTHYDILKKYSTLSFLEQDTIKYLENIKYENDINYFTWYSEGLKLKENISNQAKLY